jgi:hypothetical protein
MALAPMPDSAGCGVPPPDFSLNVRELKWIGEVVSISEQIFFGSKCLVCENGINSFLVCLWHFPSLVSQG